MRDYRLYVLMFVETRDSLISFIQSTLFYVVRNDYNGIVWISHLIHVLNSSRQPSHDIFRIKRGSYILSKSE